MLMCFLAIQLTADTGSFAVLIANGLYKPTPASNSTNQGEFIQFNGASADGTAPASVCSQTTPSLSSVLMGICACFVRKPSCSSTMT